MKITIEYNYYLLKKITKKQKEEIDIDKKNFNLEKLIGLLQIKYGKKFKSLIIDNKNCVARIPILINNNIINDLDYCLNNNDKINFLALTTGG